VHDNKQLKELAFAIGWKGAIISPEGHLVGYPPSSQKYDKPRLIPDWLHDLPACMAKDGPMEWLWKQGCEPRLTIYRDRATCDILPLLPPSVSPQGIDTNILEFEASIEENGILKACAQAICLAVLAVRKGRIREGEREWALD
jgi:hypothetical protein